MSAAPTALNGVIKKFYRDMTDEELDLIEQMQEEMENLYPQIPQFVLKRMMHRNILPSDMPLFDKEGSIIPEETHSLRVLPGFVHAKEAPSLGNPFEFSNEGENNPFSPFRMVWTIEGADEYTYFVKTSLPPKNGTVRIIDVWRKKGPVPFTPLSKQQDIFSAGENWNIAPILRKLIVDMKEDMKELEYA